MGPYSDFKSVTPNDSADLPGGPCQAVFATVAGNVNVDTIEGTTIVLPILAGYPSKIEGQIRRVRATSTTATGIIACYV